MANLKRGYYFSLDAFIAAVLLITALTLTANSYSESKSTLTLQHYSQDIGAILSSLRLSELNIPGLAQHITDYNRTVLEQAGQFWAEGNDTLAAELLNATGLFEAVPERLSFGVFFDGELIYGSSAPAQSSVISARRLVSGITKSKPVEGVVASAQLKRFRSVSGYSYAYFGGFVGQGNISFRLVLPSTTTNVTSVSLELAPSHNFSLFVNETFAGGYVKGSAGGGFMLADKWQSDSTQLFGPGINYVNITFNTSLGYIGGGFLKVGYIASEIPISFSNATYTDRYYFPGISGIINLYDSFYVPGEIKAMKMHLHYSSNLSTYMILGNVTVFSLEAPGEQILDFTNDSLAAKLDYASISSRTVPLRFSSGQSNQTSIGEGTADVVLANDLSGSMEFCNANSCATDILGPTRYCSTSANYRPEDGQYCNWTTENYTLPGGSAVCSARWHGRCLANDTRKVDALVNASKVFSSILLSTQGNRLGIVGYTNPWDNVIPQGGLWTDRFAPFPDSIVSYSNLSSNAADIANHVQNYTDSYWGTCICCGVEMATTIITNASSAERYKSIVVMSDGEATDKCIGVGTGNAKTDAIEAAHRACNDFNISVSAVAYGADADSETLQSMVCNNGTFYNVSDFNSLVAIYVEIANNLNSVSYDRQAIVNVSPGVAATHGELMRDSYVEYAYVPSQPAIAGVIPATMETARFGNNISSTTLALPVGINVTEVKVTSYSDDRWTDNLTVSNSILNRKAFVLQEYGNNYLGLGDPFIVNAKPGLFDSGDNLVRVSTATEPGNYTGGSPDNKIIYTLLVPNSVGAGSVFKKEDGCLWELSFVDGSNISIQIPPGYAGAERCYYSDSLINYTSDDATDDAAFRLLSLLDFDGDGLLDVIFTGEDIGFTIFTLSKVPSMWGPAVAEVRVWQ